METVLQIVQLILFLSLPQTFVYWLFVFSFLHQQPPSLFRRLALLTAAHSIAVDCLIYFIPFYAHVIFSLSLNLLLLFIIFYDLNRIQKIILYLFANLFAFAMDMVTGSIMVYGLGIDSRDDMIQAHFFEVISVLYPFLVAVFIASWFIRKRNMLTVKRLLATVMESERKTLLKVIALIILQFILLANLLFVQITSDQSKPQFTAVLIYLIIAVSLSELIVILRLVIRTREQAIRTTQEVYVDEINDIFTSIRGQRHDFLNHVQVIHSMVQMGKIDQLKAYVADLVKETWEVNEFVDHSSPALAAFVQAKMIVAVGKGISFTYQLPEKWSDQQSSVRIIDLIKIMGNLVDNAFDESAMLPKEERKVHASLQLTDAGIQLEVTNHGRRLDAEERKKIFLSGYSTKGEEHSGLGLSIVMERVKHYRGQINVESCQEQMTSFRITLPYGEAGLV